jgi:hypothetical protein
MIRCVLCFEKRPDEMIEEERLTSSRLLAVGFRSHDAANLDGIIGSVCEPCRAIEHLVHEVGSIDVVTGLLA